MTTDRAWMDDAGCKGTDPEAFFPETGKSGIPRAVAIVCYRCPVRRECADYADATGMRYGIWGGLTVEQRYNRRRQKLEAAR